MSRNLQEVATSILCILGLAIDKDCLYVGFIGVGAIWQNSNQDENSETQATPGGYL